jgi:predicted patatin/cPLA2 family phospholipase
MRGVFSTGILDGFLERGFDPFALGVGVSAGAGNLAAYRAGMHGRNLKIYTDYSLRPEFMDLKRFLRGGHLMDLDWLWRTTISEIRLDLKAIYADGRPLVVCLTDVERGEAAYRETTADDLEAVLKASSAVPVLYRDFPLIDGRPMADGGLVDPLPMGETIRRGARRIMVIRSRPRDYQKRENLLQHILNWKLRRFPSLREAMSGRVRRYNETIALIRRPPPGVSVIEICPPDGFRSSRLSRDPRILFEGYEQGRTLAGEAIEMWEGTSV